MAEKLVTPNKFPAGSSAESHLTANSLNPLSGSRTITSEHNNIIAEITKPFQEQAKIEHDERVLKYEENR